MEPYHKDISLSHLMDRLIVGTALELRRREPELPVVFVTKDTNLRIRAVAMGLHAVDYNRENRDVSELYTGTGEVHLDGESIARLFKGDACPIPDGTSLFENQYIVARNPANLSQSALTRAHVKDGVLQRIVELKDPVWGIRPRNKEQHFALDALLRDRRPARPQKI